MDNTTFETVKFDKSRTKLVDLGETKPSEDKFETPPR